MKRILYILILLVIVSFKVPDVNDCILELFKQTDPLDNNIYKKHESPKTDEGFGQYVDSLSYSIERQFTKTGGLKYEIILNNYNNIEFVKDYNKHVSIDTIGYDLGYKIMPSGIHIGVWENYSKFGQLKGTKNFDEIYKVSFCEFYKIAEANGLTGKTSYIQVGSNSSLGPYIWSIEKSDYKKNIFGKEKKSIVRLTLEVDSMIIKKFKVLDNGTTVYYK